MWEWSEQGSSNNPLLIDFRLLRARAFELAQAPARELRERGTYALPYFKETADYDGEPQDRGIFNAAVRMVWAQNPRVRLTRFDPASFDALYANRVPGTREHADKLVRRAAEVYPEKFAKT